ENPLVVLGVDSPAVVGDVEDRKAQSGAAVHRDVAGHAGLEVFQRVVDQIGEYLLHRQPVADDIRQRLDADLRLGLGGLMRHRSHDTLDQLAHVDLVRLELAPALAGQIEDPEIRRSILPIDDLMKPGASAKSCDSCLSPPSSSGSISLASAGTSGASAPARSSVAIRRKMSPRNCSSSLVKPMMFTSGERRSWLTM